MRRTVKILQREKLSQQRHCRNWKCASIHCTRSYCV